MKLIENEQAFMLHRRAYTDSRILVDFLSPNFGRVRGVHRAAKLRGAGRGKNRGHLQPQQFTLMQLSYRGDGELKTILSLENLSNPIPLTGVQLYCGLYLNEILTYLLPAEDPQPHLFHCYQSTLTALSNSTVGEEDICLREFELVLLAELGYAIHFNVDVSGSPIENSAESFYRFEQELGFSRVELGIQGVYLYRGCDLCAIAARQWRLEAVRSVAKRLCRQAINHHLGGRALNSRELFLTL
ncbi:DNA repair protein RecO [Teredinibacter waterburyi]|uniref:DNA repair protein RecO n=1 Tax=Teredinibacter waterburyi TaxID=1500538 RepID=UPI00165FFA62|nr:DNA repair protein RecO [Teredinibacter waterburyi]